MKRSGIYVPFILGFLIGLALSCSFALVVIFYLSGYTVSAIVFYTILFLLICWMYDGIKYSTEMQFVSLGILVGFLTVRPFVYLCFPVLKNFLIFL